MNTRQQWFPWEAAALMLLLVVALALSLVDYGGGRPGLQRSDLRELSPDPGAQARSSAAVT